jgi:hypothetical protein
MRFKVGSKGWACNGFWFDAGTVVDDTVIPVTAGFWPPPDAIPADAMTKQLMEMAYGPVGIGPWYHL